MMSLIAAYAFDSFNCYCFSLLTPQYFLPTVCSLQHKFSLLHSLQITISVCSSRQQAALLSILSPFFWFSCDQPSLVCPVVVMVIRKWVVPLNQHAEIPFKIIKRSLHCGLCQLSSSSTSILIHTYFVFFLSKCLALLKWVRDHP